MEEKGWAIKGKQYGFYTGWGLTRKDMIAEHTSMLGKTWAKCRKKGDRAVKIIIKEAQP